MFMDWIEECCFFFKCIICILPESVAGPVDEVKFWWPLLFLIARGLLIVSGLFTKTASGITGISTKKTFLILPIMNSYTRKVLNNIHEINIFSH